MDVYRSENIVARAVPCDDVSRWVVTFDNYGIGHGFDREGFSQKFLYEKGVSTVHIMGRREDWYQYPDMMEAIAAVRSHLAETDRVITYGSSMGGYAALRFADLLGADATLALSPQYSINPKKAPFETRWLQDASRINWLPESEPPLPQAARAVVVYDPATIDKLHTELIAAESKIETIPIWYSGHPAGLVVADAHLLAPLLFDVLNGVENLSHYQSAVRAARGQSSTYLVNLARALPERRASLALTLAERAVAINPTHVDALHGLAANLVSASRHDEAIIFYRRAVEAADGGIAGLIPFAEGLVRMGRYDEAMRIVREVTSSPGAAHMAHLHAWHGLIARHIGLTQEAQEAFRTATLLHPSEGAYRKLARPHVAKHSLVGLWIRRSLAWCRARIKAWQR